MHQRKKAKRNRQIRYWGKRTDFDGVTSIGYLSDHGEIIEVECVAQNKRNDKILVRFSKFEWLDIPNERICSPYGWTHIHKYYEEIQHGQEIQAKFEEKQDKECDHQKQDTSTKNWSQRTNFKYGSFIGYKHTDYGINRGIIQGKYITKNPFNNKIFVVFDEEERWLDVPK